MCKFNKIALLLVLFGLIGFYSINTLPPNLAFSEVARLRLKGESERLKKGKMYSVAIINEAEIKDMVSQVERIIYYMKGKDLNIKDKKAQLEKAKSLLKVVQEELKIKELKNRKAKKITQSYLAHSLKSEPDKPQNNSNLLQDKGELLQEPPLWKPSLEPAQPLFNLKPEQPKSRVVYNYKDINYEKINTYQERSKKLLSKLIADLQETLRNKYPWYSPKQIIESSNKRNSNPKDRILFGLRIENKGIDFHKRQWRWDLFSLYGFDSIDLFCLIGQANLGPGNYDFRYIDKMMSAIKSNGYQVDINYGAPTISRSLERKHKIPKALSAKTRSDLFWHNSDGWGVNIESVHTTVNIWNSDTMKDLLAFDTAFAKHIKKSGNTLLIELDAEPEMTTYQGNPAGYSNSAQKAFRVFLKNKYQNIHQLNKVWRTSYKDFKAIHPIKSLFPSGDEKLTPLIYDFQVFRSSSFTDYFKKRIQAIRKGYPGIPISSQSVGYFNYSHILSALPVVDAASGIDFVNLVDLDWDLWGSHDSVIEAGFAPDGDSRIPDISSLYSYSLNRYGKHFLWCDDYYWLAWEAVNIGDETILRSVLERNIWHQTAWGKRGFNFFQLDFTWENWNDKLLDEKANNEIMRYVTGVIPVLRKKLKKIENILFDIEITNQKIGIIQPSTSILVATPVWGSRDIAIKVAKRLLVKHQIPFFIPEEAIIDGREDIESFQVLIAPYATHVPPVLTEKLLNWINNGGTLISIGPFGVYDQYGKFENHLLKKLFGIDDVKYHKPSSAFGLFNSNEKVNIKWHMASNGKQILTKSYGKGKVIIGLRESFTELMQEIYSETKTLKLVDSNIQPNISDAKVFSDLELVLLNDQKGNDYIFAINLNVKKQITPKISVKGNYQHIVELGVDGGAPVIPAYRNPWTSFNAKLDPGHGILFKLIK